MKKVAVLVSLEQQMQEAVTWAKTYDIGNIDIHVIKHWLRVVKKLRRSNVDRP